MDHPRVAGQSGRARGERVVGDARERVLSALVRSEVFGCVPKAELARAAEASVLVRVARRRRLYAQGEPVVGLYVVATGRVRIVRGGGEGRALTVAYRGPGDVIGEIAVTARGRHEDTATATEPIEVVQLPGASTQALLAAQPELAHRLLRLMVERRLDTERRIESLLSRTVESRVAEFLLDAAQRYGIPDSRGLLIGVKYTHQEIAEYVGSTRETVTLTLGDLKRRDLVLFDHRRVVLRDSAALERLLTREQA